MGKAHFSLLNITRESGVSCCGSRPRRPITGKLFSNLWDAGVNEARHSALRVSMAARVAVIPGQGSWQNREF